MIPKINYQAFLEVILLLGSLLGSTLIALNCGYNQLGFAAFLVASIITTYFFRKCDASWSLQVVNVYFMCTNLIGIFRA
jgi:hypothetical protein